jgi:hypothetical protein
MVISFIDEETGVHGEKHRYKSIVTIVTIHVQQIYLENSEFSFNCSYLMMN